jgi:hypothetical protein
MWSKQCQQQKLIDAVLQMADKWRCPSVHVEGIKEGISVYDTLYSIVSTKASDMANVDHLPRIKKFNPGMTSKSAKIAALLRRFDYAKIKLPLRDRQRKPWRALVDQIEQFNPEARDGGLQHDDELDTVSMSMYIIRGKPGKAVQEAEESSSAMELLRNGETHDENGNPILFGLPLQNLTIEDIGQLLQRKQEPDGRSKV